MMVARWKPQSLHPHSTAPFPSPSLFPSRARLEVLLRRRRHGVGVRAGARGAPQQRLSAVLVHRGLVVHAVAHLVLQAHTHTHTLGLGAGGGKL